MNALAAPRLPVERQQLAQPPQCGVHGSTSLLRRAVFPEHVAQLLPPVHPTRKLEQVSRQQSSTRTEGQRHAPVLYLARHRPKHGYRDHAYLPLGDGRWRRRRPRAHEGLHGPQNVSSLIAIHFVSRPASITDTALPTKENKQ